MPIKSENTCDFYPRPPRGGRRHAAIVRRVLRVFLSTPSARRATVAKAEECKARLFLSTPSARRATASPVEVRKWNTNFYPRPPRGGRRKKEVCKWTSTHFYPRPPRGGRLGERFVWLLDFLISIHALREEGDFFGLAAACTAALFLSTPSARRATRWWRVVGLTLMYFYPRPPRGGRLTLLSV